MLRVKSDLCRGCGLCIESCPQQAISIVAATARINQERCDQCNRCIKVCPQSAIMEITPVSRHELLATVAGMKDRTEDIVARIEKLRDKQRRI